MNLRNVSTEELQKELAYRENNPQWFIRELVSEGYDLDNDEFRSATDWIDDQCNNPREE